MTHLSCGMQIFVNTDTGTGMILCTHLSLYGMGSQVSGPTFGDASFCINYQHQHLKSNATTPPTKCEHDELKTAQNMRGPRVEWEYKVHLHIFIFILYTDYD